jgi:hypothetical protein
VHKGQKYTIIFDGIIGGAFAFSDKRPCPGGTTKNENGIQESGVRIQNEEWGDFPSAC